MCCRAKPREAGFGSRRGPASQKLRRASTPAAPDGALPACRVTTRDGHQPARDEREGNGAQRKHAGERGCLQVWAPPMGTEQDTRSPGPAQSAPRHALRPPRTSRNGRACAPGSVPRCPMSSQAKPLPFHPPDFPLPRFPTRSSTPSCPAGGSESPSHRPQRLMGNETPQDGQRPFVPFTVVNGERGPDETSLPPDAVSQPQDTGPGPRPWPWWVRGQSGGCRHTPAWCPGERFGARLPGPPRSLPSPCRGRNKKVQTRGLPSAPRNSTMARRRFPRNR